MKCNKCGKENRDNSKFCSGCGTSLVEPKKKEKVDVNSLQISAKIGYYSRFVALGIIGIYLIIIIGILLISLTGISFSEGLESASSDPAGYAILGALVFGVMYIYVLYFIFLYAITTGVLNFVLPYIWIHRKKRVSAFVEVLRIIALVLGLIMLILPFILCLIMGPETFIDFVSEISLKFFGLI